MALLAGELVAMLGLESGPFDSGLEKAMGKLGDKGAWNKAAAAGGLAAGAALGAGLVSAVDFDGLERKMDASLGLTEQQAAEAGEAAGNLYAGAWGDSMEEVTAATEAVMSSIPGMMDAPAAEIESMTAKVLDMAQAFEVDAGRAAQVAGQMIHTGLAKDGANAADLLAASMQKVPKALREDLVDAIDEYGPSFSQLGLSGEAAMSMLVKGSEKGMYGIDKTGDAIKEFALLVSTDMGKTQKPIESLGLNYEDMAAKLLAGGEEGAAATGQIIDGLLAMKDPVKQAQTAVELFGTPIEDLNTGDIPKFLESLKGAEGGLGDFSGTAERVGDDINGGPGVALLEFKRTVETTFAGMAESVLPAITPIANMLTTMAPFLGPLALALGVFAGAIWLVQAAVAAWNVIQMVMNATLWASPITWVVAGIIALIAIIVLLVANWDTVVAWITEIWGGFISWITAGINAFGAWWSGVWQGILDFFTGVWDSASEGVSGFIDDAIQWFKDLPGKILDALGNLGSLLLDAGGQIIQGFLDGLTAGFNHVKDFVGGIGSWIADHKGPKQYDLGLLVPAGGWIMDGLETGIEASMPSLGATLGDVSWMVANGIDPEFGAVTGNSVTAPVESGGHTFNVTIEGQKDPEEAWQVFKSRANESLRGQGASIRL
ncbi:hypothetical protein GCM10027417_30610 [Glutamicibacter endophyticus]